jgi:HEAT repeat protein
VVDILLERLERERDHGLQVAYAASLGQLGETAVTPTLLTLLDKEQDPTARDELALALARLVGEESGYIQMLRQVRGDMATAVSQIILSMNKKFASQPELMAETALAFSRGQYETGVEQLVALVEEVVERPLREPNEQILAACLEHLAEFGVGRQEYLLLLFLVL